ncbi:MAG: MBL fold metallo-hydrolase, partial [Proteobacteria bacterium]|nr:MBL fold metallo-hydrolase [Pseudomonadota bacterium]
MQAVTTASASGTDAVAKALLQCRIDRRFLLSSALAFTVAPVLGKLSAQAEGALSFAEVASGVFVHQGRYELQSPDNKGDMANASFIVGSEAVAVIDTLGSAKVAHGIRTAIRAVTDKPIRFVVNSHMHPDHVFGNAAFKEDNPQFVGHHKLARGLSERAGQYQSANKEMLGDDAFEGSEIILPTLSVDEKLTLDLGGRSLSWGAQKRAHTGN